MSLYFVELIFPSTNTIVALFLQPIKSYFKVLYQK